MPRTFLFSLALFFGSTLWKLVPPLVFLLTGWRVRIVGTGGDPFYSSLWIQAGLLVFLLSSWELLFGSRYLGKASKDQNRLAAGLSILFLYLGYSLQHFTAEISTSQSNAAAFVGVAWVYAAAGGVFLFFMARPPRESLWLLGTALAFLAALTPLVVQGFPFDKNFSDVLLDVREACLSLLRGVSPYGLEQSRIWEGGSSYFPGLWLAYLPAVALNLDLRYLGALYLAGFAFLVWRGTEPTQRTDRMWFLILFLLNPWLLLRQDTYIYAYLFCWGGFFLSLSRGKIRTASIWYGVGLSMHLFSWAVLPVWAAWLTKGRGIRAAFKDLIPAAAVAALVLLPFVIWDPGGFIQGTLIHFAGGRSIAVSHFGLAGWFSGYPGFLSVLSFVFLVVGAYLAWRGKPTLHSLFAWLAVSLGLALLASYHIEHYYYLIPLVFLLFHEIAPPRNGKSNLIKN